jgi:hypothetical protein
VGAAIGEQFQGNLVARVFGWSAAETAAALRPAVAQGLLRALPGDGIDPADPVYQFAHHRIRAQVYAQLPDEERLGIHHALAEALKALGNRDATTVLQIADHLNAAIGLLEPDDARRIDCAYHNLLAGRDALRQGAYQQAYKYSRAGLALGLARDGAHAAMVEALSENAAEAAFLCGDFEQLHRVIAEAPAGNSRIDEVRVRAAVVQNQLAESRRIAEDALARLESPVASPPQWQQRLVHAPLTGRLLRGARRVRRRLQPDLPTPLRVLDDVRRHQALRLQGYLLHTGYHMAAPELPALARSMLRQANRFGHCAEVGFASAAMAVQAVTDGDPAAARRLADQARLLADRFPDEAFALRTRTLLAGLVEPWLQPVDPLLTALGRQYRASWELKDFEFTAAASVFYAWNSLMRGIELGALRQTLHEQITQLTSYPHITDVNVSRFALQMVNSLTGGRIPRPSSAKSCRSAIRRTSSRWVPSTSCASTSPCCSTTSAAPPPCCRWPSAMACA